MLGAGSSPRGRRATPVLVWLLPTVVTAAVAVAAASVASAGARAGVAWCGAVGTTAVAVVAAETARRGRALATLREQSARQEIELRRRLAEQEAETVRLATSALPEAVARLQRGEFSTDVLKAHESHNPVVGADFQAALHAVLRTVLEAVDNEEGMREAAQRAFVNIARRVQAIVHRQAHELREMEHLHGNDPAVFGDLLRLDHGNALIGRLADSIAVLGGARPGRQWSRSVPLYSVLRGGMSRILDYQRVELHPVSDVAVVGPAVEPLIHAVAELLDNATRYSPPHTSVHLTAAEVQTGIAIEIEDGGLSLSEEGRARAERMLREAQAGIDLNDLGETPRLGLAVVGRLAQAYGFQVSLRHSAYGGVRAVLIVPQELITTAPATGRAHGIGVTSTSRPDPSTAPSAAGFDRSPWGARKVSPPGTGSSAGRSAAGPFRSSAAAPSAAGDDLPVVTERAANGLPQRRRHGAPVRRPVPGTGRPGARAVPEPAPEPVQPGLWLAAFHEGVNGTGPAATADGPTVNGHGSGATGAQGTTTQGTGAQGHDAGGHGTGAHSSEESAGKGEQ
ncbi:ATP-binding protein [Kitasatospora sp. NPDC090091]|uniref:ATP-binding protein n=1 Tax=Kitasatospora sp. NPDC090091 TaxID=3364081 RepID=UPI0037F250F9